MAITKTNIYKRAIRELADEPSGLERAFALYVDAVGPSGAYCYYVDQYRGRNRQWVPAWHTTLACPQCLGTRHREFVRIVNEMLGDNAPCEAVVCTSACQKPRWLDDCETDTANNPVCPSCKENIVECSRCGYWNATHNSITWVGEERFCDDCRDNNAHYCDECDEWYLQEWAEEHDHRDWCECAPQELEFQILANSHGSLKQDERLKVAFPSGFIADEAINACINTLWYRQFSDLYHQEHARMLRGEPDANADKYYIQSITDVVNALDREWQTKRGNFTRRLSSALYKELGVKLDSGVLSEVGSVMRNHSTSVNSWFIEFTRDLNQPATAFFHGGSCWWGSENASLCAFKHWGGVGMRSYQSEDQQREWPSGRAWVQPLNADLQPTQDVYNAHAYVIYNGYGDLSGYAAARIVAYFTSRTYKKIDFEAAHQYVNSGGYLVADQETCDKTSELTIQRRAHDKVAA